MREARTKLGEALLRFPDDARLCDLTRTLEERRETDRTIGVTRLEYASVPTGFFSPPTGPTSDPALSIGRLDYGSLKETLQFFRENLSRDYDMLSREAKSNYALWVLFILISLGILVAGIVLLFRNQVAAGTVTTLAAGLPSFVSQIFRRREDQYRDRADAKREHLEFGNQCLLVIANIDMIADARERTKQQIRLVAVLTSKLKQPKPKTGQPSKVE